MSLADAAEELLRAATAELPNGGEDRPGQVLMARAVAEAIDQEQHLVVQAGTGTGKSLAYLVPAVLSGRRVLVATATKALQDQLADKELPHLHRVTDHAFSWAVLKGRNNYVCRQRVGEHNRTQGTLEGVGGSQQEEIDRLLVWADQTETGDRAELDFEPTDRAWAAVSVTSNECPGRSKCPSGDSCLAEAARAQAQEADVIVVNTHLLGLNLYTDGAILPEADLVIVDEAHQLEDVITSTCGWSVGSGRFSAVARAVKAILEDTATFDDLEDSGALIGDALAPLVGTRLPSGKLSGNDQYVDLLDAMSLGRERINATLEKLRGVPQGKDMDADARRSRAMKLAESLLVDLTANQAITEKQVAWVEDSFRSPVLRVAPLDVGTVLGPALWDRVTTVLTSATIPEGLSAHLGLSADAATETDVPSPFDYPKQGLLYCARHLPEPRAPDYEEELLRELERLMVAAGGRTLALFTSWRRMEAAADHLIGRLPGKVYTQRDLPKPALIQAFTDDEESSLLATIGFWQGIDVPGPSLSLVTIDRLPFPRPDDPLLEARRENAGPAAFRLIDLPRATTLLAQGVGRLIRTMSDEGVVAVLDQRLATKKSYRWQFIESMPPFTRTSDRELATTRLRTLREAREAAQD